MNANSVDNYASSNGELSLSDRMDLANRRVTMALFPSGVPAATLGKGARSLMAALAFGAILLISFTTFPLWTPAYLVDPAPGLFVSDECMDEVNCPAGGVRGARLWRRPGIPFLTYGMDFGTALLVVDLGVITDPTGTVGLLVTPDGGFALSRTDKADPLEVRGGSLWLIQGELGARFGLYERRHDIYYVLVLPAGLQPTEWQVSSASGLVGPRWIPSSPLPAVDVLFRDGHQWVLALLSLALLAFGFLSEPTEGFPSFTAVLASGAAVGFSSRAVVDALVRSLGRYGSSADYPGGVSIWIMILGIAFIGVMARVGYVGGRRIGRRIVRGSVRRGTESLLGLRLMTTAAGGFVALSTVACVLAAICRLVPGLSV